MKINKTVRFIVIFLLGSLIISDLIYAVVKIKSAPKYKTIASINRVFPSILNPKLSFETITSYCLNEDTLTFCAINDSLKITVLKNSSISGSDYQNIKILNNKNIKFKNQAYQAFPINKGELDVSFIPKTENDSDVSFECN